MQRDKSFPMRAVTLLQEALLIVLVRIAAVLMPPSLPMRPTLAGGNIAPKGPAASLNEPTAR